MAAATAITRAHQIVLGRINQTLSDLGLNFSRFEAIALLSFTRTGQMPLGKMGERLQVHPTSITNTIDRLERDGLVKRVPHATDGRTVLAEITDEGRRMAEKGAEALAQISFGLDGVGSADLRSLDDTIRVLRHSAGDFE